MSDSQVNWKRGDKVIRTKNGYPEFGIVKGNVYTILDVSYEEEDEYADIRLAEDIERWYDKTNFELYLPVQESPTELEEALAKIDTLEEALEDAVKELISLRSSNNTAVIGVKDSEFKLAEFKPISEMTMEDWKLAYDRLWEFELRSGEVAIVSELYANTGEYVVGLGGSTQTMNGKVFYWNEDHHNDVIKRIK